MRLTHRTLGICTALSLIVGCGADDTSDSLSGFSEAATSSAEDSATESSDAASESAESDSMSAGDGDETSTSETSGDGDSATGDGDGDSTTTGDGDGDGDGDSTSGDGDGDGDSTTGDGDGDGDSSTGDGDGDSTTGDGDGDSTTGDGDGDSTTGDGDGDSTTGDGDGDSTTGDGDGDSTTGDGDGDSTTGDGDGDGDSTSSTGDGDGDDGGACFIDPFIAEPNEPYVMLVLDKSGSMFDNQWDPDGGGPMGNVTRWNSLYTVVDDMLTEFDQEIYFGMQIFPLESATADLEQSDCNMPSPGSAPTVSASLNTSMILTSMPAAGTMSGASNAKGGTPSRRGVEQAVDHLVFTVNPARERFIILVTDGAANCDLSQANPPGTTLDVFNTYDSVLHDVVQAARVDHDIKTFVVGIDIQNQSTGNNANDGIPDDINPFVMLETLSEDGGTDRPPPAPSKFYNADDQVALQSDLQQILTDLQSCVIPLESDPPLPDDTIVEVNGVEIPKVTDCATEDGWVYVEPAPPYANIELCNAACDTLKLYGEAEVQFFCDAG